jgi:hypothetical protein
MVGSTVAEFSRPAELAELVEMVRAEWSLIHGVVLSDEDATRIAKGIITGLDVNGIGLRVAEPIAPITNEQEGC